jgi:hypothetical protein
MPDRSEQVEIDLKGVNSVSKTLADRTKQAA